MQSLCKIAILCTEHNIEVQAYKIFTKQYSLADMLFCDQYRKIANNYPSLQIAQSTFETSLKASI